MTLEAAQRFTDAGFAASGMKGLCKPFLALVDSKMACEGGS